MDKTIQIIAISILALIYVSIFLIVWLVAKGDNRYLIKALFVVLGLIITGIIMMLTAPIWHN